MDAVRRGHRGAGPTPAKAAQLAAAPDAAPCVGPGPEVDRCQAMCTASRPLQFAPASATISRAEANDDCRDIVQFANSGHFTAGRMFGSARSKRLT